MARVHTRLSPGIRLSK